MANGGKKKKRNVGRKAENMAAAVVDAAMANADCGMEYERENKMENAEMGESCVTIKTAFVVTSR
jgi:hypothetical protein